MLFQHMGPNCNGFLSLLLKMPIMFMWAFQFFLCHFLFLCGKYLSSKTKKIWDFTIVLLLYDQLYWFCWPSYNFHHCLIWISVILGFWIFYVPFFCFTFKVYSSLGYISWTIFTLFIHLSLILPAFSTEAVWLLSYFAIFFVYLL